MSDEQYLTVDSDSHWTFHGSVATVSTREGKVIAGDARPMQGLWLAVEELGEATVVAADWQILGGS